MYLLTYSGNWNDEINVDGFIIINNDKKKIIIELLENYDETIYIGNGGDDEIEYENGKELLEEISFERITKDEIKVIDRYFGNFNDYGYNLLLNINKLSNDLNIL